MKSAVDGVRLEARSPIPPFEQIRAQVTLLVATGRLRPGARLPTIRSLAGRLSVANGTVARAYRELERNGIVEGRGRGGTFVVDEPPVAYAVVERQERLDAAAERFALEVGALDVGAADAIEAVTAALRNTTED